MNQSLHIRSARGFSLIEVMVAVVVLSVGLLALAALQASLIRASAESKAQSVAVSLAKEQIESIRNFRTLDAYRALVDGNGTVSMGGVDYALSQEVARFAFDGAAFQPVADTGDLGADYVENNEFKRITVSVTWDDATGTARTLAMEDVISALDPSDTARLTRVSKTNAPRPAQMIIHNPAASAGVIPIAIGDGTDTAATNPKPVVAGRNNNERVVETRFDVLTYAALSGSEARAQSRVETSVVGCTCDTRNGGTSVPRGKRPTYWDGEKYVAPETAAYSAPAGHASLGNNDPPESPLCTACCRDHHDKQASSSLPRFSRRLSGQHEHYAAGDLSTPVTSGLYNEACRIIRVDGIFRVAADAYNDKFGLLATSGNGTSPLPSTGAATGYQNYVLNHVTTRFATSNTSAYNIRDVAGVAYTLPYVDAANDLPTPLDINAIADFKWLHSRGLYIDYLEEDALQFIKKINDDCNAASCTSATRQRRVLSALPFTTINLSEIANWSPLSGDDIVVTNNDFISSISTNTPVRGKVLPGASPTNGNQPVAAASMFERNSGLALFLGAVRPEESTALTDEQGFRIVGSSSSGGRFTVTMDGGYPFSSASNAYPEITSTPGAVCNYATSGGSRPNPYTCTTGEVGVSRVLTIGRYNYQLTTSSRAAITCRDAGGDNPVTWNPSGNDAYTTKTCRNFAITSVTPTITSGGIGAAANDGLMSETTDITYTSPLIGNGASISLTFGTPVDTVQPLTCRYNTNGETNQNKWSFTVTSPDCP